VQTGSVLTPNLPQPDTPGRKPRSRLLHLAGILLLLGLAACSGGSAHQPAAVTPGMTGTANVAAAGTATDWLQYHANGARSGAVAGLPAAGRLSVAWSRKLGGAVYGQPLVIGSTVVAATEQDEVFGLNRNTGTVRWKTKVGTPLPMSRQPCGNVTPLGVTSTPVYDPQTRLVYVVAQSGAAEHVLAALRVSDGHIAFSRHVPSPDHQAAYDQQRGALALTNGHIYVVFGGHYGDCGPYVGSVVAMPATRHGPIWSYRVPTRKQGGIWASGGPVVGPDGTIYVSVGNGAIVSRTFDDSDSVTALTPRLQRIGVFAPAGWRTLSAGDADLGSMSPALLSNGQILQVGKSGVGYLLNAAHLGGVGGQLAQGKVCAAFGGAAVSGTTVYVPCPGSGLRAVSTAGGRVVVIWHTPGGIDGSPVIGGSAIWAASSSAGVLYELAPKTGRIRQEIRLPVGAKGGEQLPHFVSPTLSGRLVLIGTMTGVVAVAGA
jgi:polyvinyl alcohol dehydrogenase (cytochrome)